MQFIGIITLSLATLLPFALAQYDYGSGATTTTSSSAAATTSSSAPAVHTVQVGASGLSFTPSSLTAAKGDKILFQFASSIQHSVVQGKFDSPCAPLSNSSFYSGTLSQSAFTVMVNDTTPIFFYCGIPTHCGSGMVGVINPLIDGSQGLDAYKAAAAKVSSSSTPLQAQGGVIGTPSSSTTGGSSTSSSPSASATTKTGAAGRASWNWSLVVGLGALWVLV